MNKLKKVIICVAMAAGAVVSAYSQHVAINTPMGFQVLGLSANGKWACGVYVDAAVETYPFRWNLDTGEIEMLGTSTGTAWDVANDGTVSGDFLDTQATNGAAFLPGYWRDGAWQSMEMPEGATDGMGTGISPDGHYMTGSVEVGGLYKAFIWKDGKIHCALPSKSHAVASAVAPDGTGAAGYNTLKNRTACYWNINDAEPTNFLHDDAVMNQSPWCYARNFSPDGKKIVYWGGWIDKGDGEQGDAYLYCIYDLEKKEFKYVKSPAYSADLEFFDISNNEMIVGLYNTRAYMYINGEGVFFDDYLKSRGVDLSDYVDFYKGTDHYQGQLPINKIVAVSEDENVFACQYYNTIGELTSLIVKIDQDFTQVAPVNIVAKQLQGINTVGLTWKLPVGVEAVRGYNVYRDGKKISGILPLNVPYFYDKNLADGTYVYEVSAITPAGVETRAKAVTVEVTSNYGQRPLALFGRQKGYSDAYVEWNAPLSNIAHKYYHNAEGEDYAAFAINAPMTVEMGIAFTKGEMTAYKGYKISEVSFMPMAEQKAWTVNIYTRGANGKPQLYASQPVTQQLEYGKMNTVKFDTPVDVPSEEVIVAVEVSVGTNPATIAGEQGAAVFGYSDLLRQKSEDDFFSLYESSAESGYQIVSMSWVIDLGLTASAYDEEANAITHYNIYLDGALKQQTTETSLVLPAVASGKHKVGVEAVFKGAGVSPKAEAEFQIKSAYPQVNTVDIVLSGSRENTINASWVAPVNDDQTNVSYTNAASSTQGVKGLASNGYAIMIGAEYPAKLLRGYAGYNVKSVRFYPLGDALFTIFIYEDGNLIVEQEVDDFKIDSWNEVALDTDVTIKAGSTYRLVLDIFDPEPDKGIAAIDDHMSQAYLSDLYSTDNGETWGSVFTDSGSRGNWLLGMRIVDPEVDGSAAEGYDVLVDNVKVNADKVRTNAYSHTFDQYDTKMHTIRVNTYYPLVADAVAGRQVYFRLSSAGVDDMTVADVTLRQGDNYLVADGAQNVELMEVYNTAGALVAASHTNKVKISGLTGGLYLVKVVSGDKTATYKVNIHK